MTYVVQIQPQLGGGRPLSVLQVHQHGVPRPGPGGRIYPGYKMCDQRSKIENLSSTSNINVAVTPRARIRFWRNLLVSNIHRGEDVYFECDIKANPAVYNVTWRHNVNIVIIVKLYFIIFNLPRERELMKM